MTTDPPMPPAAPLQARLIGGAAGFSLLECLIAMLVMSAGALGVGRLQRVLESNADVARQRLVALHLAEQKLEQLREPAHLGKPLSSAAPAFNTTEAPAGTGNASYTRRWSSTTTTISDSLHVVTVDVDWTDRAGRPQTIGLVSMVARSDLAVIARLSSPLPTATGASSPAQRAIDATDPSRSTPHSSTPD